MRLPCVVHCVPDVAATVAFHEAAAGPSARLAHASGVWAEPETGATALAFVAEDLEGGEARSTRSRPTAEPWGRTVA